MSALVIVLRMLAVLAFAAVLLGVGARRGGPETRARHRGGGPWPVAANLLAVGSFFFSLVVFSGSADGGTALLMASSGFPLAVAGAALVLRSRAELGAAWSLVPRAGQETGLVTTGPYRWIRHPIYLGFVLLALGEALAFRNWLACSIALFGIVPTFAWRARVEETLLSRTFGEGYGRYQRRTKLIVPYLL